MPHCIVRVELFSGECGLRVLVASCARDNRIVVMDSSNDWPSDFQELKTIDALLRCPICYEYMEAAVSLRTCLHSFCSVCVRRYLSKYQKDCPQCHGAAVEADVVANRTLGELIDQFKAVRGRVLKAVNSLATTAGTVPSAPTPSTEVQRSVQPVAAPPPVVATAAVPKSRRSEPKPCFGMATLTQDFLVSSGPCNGEAKPVGNHNLLPSTYHFSEPLEEEASVLVPHTVLHQCIADARNSAADGNDSAALVPEPPHSMPDTQQIIDNGDMSVFMHSSVRDEPIPQASNPITVPDVAAISSMSSSSTALSVSSTTCTPSAPGQDLSDMVPCPVCTTLVPSRSVNAHLDRCLRQEDHKPSLPSLPSASRTTASSCQSVVLVDSDGKSNVANMSRATPMLPVPAPKKDPSRKAMPRLVYTLLSDKQLRKHLKDNGLPTHGSKQAMVKRHQEFVLRYNADADSSRPRTAAEIVKAMEEEERGRGTSIWSGKGVNASSQKPLRFESHHSTEDKDKLRQDYAVQHNQHFSSLIEAVRQKRAKPRDVPTNTPPVPSTLAASVASSAVRYSPRNSKKSSTPSYHLPAKRRRSAKKKVLPLSDQELSSPDSSNSDIDAAEFLKSPALSSSQSRRSTRKRPTRPTYVDAGSSDDMFQPGEESLLPSPSPTPARKKARRRTKRIQSSSATELSQDTLSAVTSDRSQVTEASPGKDDGSVEKSFVGDAATDVSLSTADSTMGNSTLSLNGVGVMDAVMDGCTSDTTAEYCGPEEGGEREDFTLDSQPLLTAPILQQQFRNKADNMHHVPGTTLDPKSLTNDVTCNSVDTSACIADDDDAETQFLMDDDDGERSCTANAKPQDMQLLPTTPTRRILAEETQLPDCDTTVQDHSQRTPVARISRCGIIEETQNCCKSPEDNMSTSDSPSMPPLASRSGGKARLLRKRRKDSLADSQIDDPTYDPFTAETVRRAAREADSSEYKRSLRQRHSQK